jgi:hypothetical protein
MTDPSGGAWPEGLVAPEAMRAFSARRRRVREAIDRAVGPDEADISGPIYARLVEEVDRLLTEEKRR